MCFLCGFDVLMCVLLCFDVSFAALLLRFWGVFDVFLFDVFLMCF